MSDLVTMNDEELNASLVEDAVVPIPEDEPDGNEVLSDEEIASASPPPSEPEVKPDEQSPEQPALTLESLQEQLTKMESRLKEKDQFIGRQANMIGELKKLSAQPQQKVEMPTDEEFISQPTEAMKKLLAAQEAEKQQATARQQQEYELLTTRNKEITAQFVPEFDNLMPDIEKVLTEEDGLTPEILSGFKGNPYATPPEVLIQLAKRVQQRNKITELTSELDTLKAEVEKLRGKSSRVLDTVEKTARQTTQVRPSTSPAGNAISLSQLSTLSYDELQKQLEE